MQIVDLLAAGAGQVSILIVPSGAWSEDQLSTLRSWERDGHLLGAHGWTHRSVEPRGLYHRLHSSLFSRDVAEHLGRSSSEVLEIVRRGEQWFAAAGLRPPKLYVPPAWALGSIPLSAFHDTPFRWVETLTGVYDTSTSRFHRLPLVGFEADTRLRAWSLRLSNRVNSAAALALRRPLRAAVHPNDLRLALSAELAGLLTPGRPSASLADL